MSEGRLFSDESNLLYSNQNMFSYPSNGIPMQFILKEQKDRYLAEYVNKIT